ncbi:hypothetical protein LAZ67_7001118 [Cordylochernes scorpioides]|uniref:Reverse transcriptase Ty1/copia-type domain-containing protein n=1 Tax=Cordylochernes scorpioides TaxID=51811 RepID=A0ABY6KMK3_9ARAC|nr:hypothetical protein LAZ67_7001118 [Cordylochernes scorpioides]
MANGSSINFIDAPGLTKKRTYRITKTKKKISKEKQHGTSASAFGMEVWCHLLSRFLGKKNGLIVIFTLKRSSKSSLYIRIKLSRCLHGPLPTYLPQANLRHVEAPETSELNEETIPTLDEPNEERIVRSGRKKGDTQKVLEEKHRAKLREEEMKLLEQGVRRSQRIKERNNVNFILEPEERIPENYEEAINCENKYEWLEAMKEELYSIDKHKVWTLVQRQKNMKIINCKWIFSIKSTPGEGVYRRKARLVAIGCNQKYGVEYEESFSPVIRKESLRAIVALAAQLNLVITSYDVKTAYLYGELKETIFMKLPEGFVEKGEEDKVCKLLKSIYGLPQSGHCWNKKITTRY